MCKKNQAAVSHRSINLPGRGTANGRLTCCVFPKTPRAIIQSLSNLISSIMCHPTSACPTIVKIMNLSSRWSVDAEVPSCALFQRIELVWIGYLTESWIPTVPFAMSTRKNRMRTLSRRLHLHFSVEWFAFLQESSRVAEEDVSWSTDINSVGRFAYKTPQSYACFDVHLFRSRERSRCGNCFSRSCGGDPNEVSPK